MHWLRVIQPTAKNCWKRPSAVLGARGVKDRCAARGLVAIRKSRGHILASAPRPAPSTQQISADPAARRPSEFDSHSTSRDRTAPLSTFGSLSAPYQHYSTFSTMSTGAQASEDAASGLRQRSCNRAACSTTLPAVGSGPPGNCCDGERYSLYLQSSQCRF